MKKILLTAATAFFSLFIFANEPVNEKVLQAFNQSFKNVKEVIWHEYGDHYEVKFKQNEIRSRVSYDADGNILKAIRYYTADGLPIFVRAKLESKYKGKKVFGVTEVASNDELKYHIVLEDEKTWTHVEGDSFGNMITTKKFKKA